MATHYLIDLHNDQIVGVRSPSNGATEVTGFYVVRVPSNLAVEPPNDLSDLLANKESALLAKDANFTHSLGDTLLDGAHVDTGSDKVLIGSRGTVGLLPAGTLLSTKQDLSLTPTQAAVYYETFEYIDSSPKDLAHVRTYQEVSTSYVRCEVSFDNGLHYFTTMDGALFNIPEANRGNQFIIRFTNVTNPAKRVYLGNWTLLY